MGRELSVRLKLICGFFSLIPAHIAQSQSILGPDGRGPSPAAPRPAHPSLEEQLRRRKNQDAERPWPKAEQPATATEDLLTPQERRQLDQMQVEMKLKEADPRFRMHLGMAPTWAQRTAGPVDTWRFDPGIIWQASLRLTDPAASYGFWTGLHLASWNGSGRSESSFSRFAALYAGPLFAFEWRGKPRQTLAFGLAGVSRQADPNFPGDANRLATKDFGLDGTGLWLNYGLAFRIKEHFEWEARAGVHSGASYLLSYLSLGVSLWTD